MNESILSLTIDECKKLFRQTRDFDLYLDMLNRLKNKYLIILCLKDTTDQSISEQTAEKIHSLGFSGFTSEPYMKYAGVLSNGSAVLDHSSGSAGAPATVEGDVQKTNIRVLFGAFEGKEAEIRINGKDLSMNDNGINVVVYDPKKPELVDVCCYNASEGNPVFYHCNFYYDERYIDSHVYMPESFKAKAILPMRRSYFSPRSLNVREVERAIFLPSKITREVDKNGKLTDVCKTAGGVCDESFRPIAGHKLHSTRNVPDDARHISGSYEVPQEELAYIDETVLYGGSLIEHPGHLITECFADRLWWIAENPDSEIKIAIETIGESSLLGTDKSFVMDFFDALGVSENRVIIIKKPTQFKKLIVPDQSAIPLYYCFPYDFTDGYIKPFQRITQRLSPGKHKKIYLTKSKLYRRSVIGEEYFIDFFEKKGFAVINPEDYSLKEKAELMQGAEEVVTIDGTNSLFTVFCKPSVKLTILTRRMDYWDTPQQLITEALGIKEFYLVNISGNFLDSFSSNAFGNYARGMTLAYVTKEFKSYVKNVYNEEIDITPEESLKEHIYDYLSYFPEYYSQSDYTFFGVFNVKMTDILRGMSEVFLGKALDTGDFIFLTEEENKLKTLELRLQKERDASAEKIKSLTEKAKEFIDEITSLKNSLAQRDAEIERLREKNSELSAYMGEISQLLDALEAQGDSPK